MLNNQFLYAFRGYVGDNKYLDSIEILNIDDIVNGWQNVKIEDPGSAWMPSAYSCVTVINPNMILICGGKNEEKLLYNTYYYDPLKKTIYRGKDLARPAIFNTWGIVTEDKIYNIDYKNDSNRSYGVHTYDLNENFWSFN